MGKSINQSVLLGRVGRDEPKFNDNRTRVEFSLATDRYNPETKKNDATSWHRIVSFREWVMKGAEFIKPGDLVCVTGSYEVEEYTNRDGEKRTMARMHAMDMQLLTPRGNGDGGERQPRSDNRGGSDNRRSNDRRQDNRRDSGRRAPAPEPATQDSVDDDIPF